MAGDISSGGEIAWRIKRLGKGDIGAIIDLWNFSGLHIKPGGRDSPENLEKQMDMPMVSFMGAFEGDRMAGVVLVTHDGRKGWINRIAVHPDSRRKGLGLVLVKVAERRLVEQGIDIWCALVEDWNDASMAMLKRAGYTLHDDITYFSRRGGDNV